MAGVKGAVRSWVTGWWLLAQSTLAGTTAWVVARRVDDERLPFFAPIVAIVVLNFARGERGLHAVRLIVGVAIGIGCGEVVVLLLGSTVVALASAAFVAMAATLAVTDSRLALNQAGAAAVLTVVFAGGEADYARLVDAFIGVGVALVFTQVLFSPEPVALVRRAERQALRGIADELRRAARHLARDDAPHEPDLSRLRRLRGQIVDVGWAGAASLRAARRSVLWRHRARRLAPVTETAGQLELLGSSCMTFLRTASLTRDREQRRRLAPHVEELAEVVAALAVDPADQGVRQQAVRRALRVARDVSAPAPPVPATEETAAVTTFLLVVFDLLVFAGVTPPLAQAAMRGDTDEVPVVGLPAELRLPLWPRRRR